MPVRMVDDEDNDSRDNNSGGGSSGGGGGNNGGLIAIILLLLTALWKWPKTTITILIIVGILYFFFGGDSGDTASSSKNKGCSMKQEVFDQAEVFEPLSPDRNTLPASISLLKYAPKRRSQGQQGSCVGWASAYAARTILESAATGVDPNSIIFSPSFLYNQIGLADCQGSYVVDAMKTMMQVGSLPLDQFPYDPSTCSRQPDDNQKDAAGQYLIRGYNRLTLDGDDYSIDQMAMKQNLAQGAPVVIGMAVGGSFESQDMYGAAEWIPSGDDENDIDNFGGHALCVIGYDDNRNGGSFQIMNSWGDDWGDNGIFWMPYTSFGKFCREAYGLYPLERKAAQDKSKLDVAFGLVNNDSRNYIALKQKSTYTFVTTETQSIGTKFKIEVNNNSDCYTYVMGEETDNSNYVLFPYTEKHSPYCGIVGARLFPKGQSMMLDDKGTKDRMAVIVSKVPIDFKELSDKINAQSVSGYENKIKAALSGMLIADPDFSDGETVGIKSNSAEEKCTFMVFEILKQ